MIFAKEELQNLIKHKDVQSLRAIFDEYNIVDLTELVMRLEDSEILFLFKTLHKSVSAQIFAYLPQSKKESLIKSFTGPEIQDMLQNMYDDDMVDFIEEMPANLVSYILSSVSHEQREQINVLLNYPESSAGSIMSTQFITLKGLDTVSQAFKKVREFGERNENNNHCYITDDNRELVGTITLRELLFVDETTYIEDIMETDVIAVNTFDDQEEVVKLFQKYDLTIIPVVNDQHRLIGVITADDILDVIQEEATEDIQKLGAITPLEKSYKETSIFEMAKSRVVWLLILMISATLTGEIMENYESLLAANVLLSVFIPMLMDTSGNAGSQASTMIIRALAMGEITPGDFIKVWWKESRVAFLCGVSIGLVNFFRMLIFMQQASLMTAIVVSVSIFITIMIAKLIGCTLPIIAVKLKQDPALMAGPLITTLVDAMALFVFFQLASQFLL